MEQDFTFTPEEIAKGKTMAGISYLGVLGLIVAYILNRENRFTRYHIQQALIVAVAFLFTPLPFIGLVTLAASLIFCIIGALNGFKGKVKPLPLLGKSALKIGLVKPQPTTDNEKLSTENTEKEAVEKKEIEKENVEKEAVEKKEVEKENVEKEEVEKKEVEKENVEKEDTEKKDI